MSYKARIVTKAITMCLIALAGVACAIMNLWPAAGLSLVLIVVGALKIKSLMNQMRGG